MKKQALLQMVALIAIFLHHGVALAQRPRIESITLGRDSIAYYIVSPSDLGYIDNMTRYEDLRESVENCEVTIRGTKYKILCCPASYPTLFYRYYMNPVKKGFECPVITQPGKDFYQLRLTPTDRRINHHVAKNAAIPILTSVNTKWTNDAEFIFALEKIEADPAPTDVWVESKNDTLTVGTTARIHWDVKLHSPKVRLMYSFGPNSGSWIVFETENSRGWYDWKVYIGNRTSPTKVRIAVLTSENTYSKYYTVLP